MSAPVSTPTTPRVASRHIGIVVERQPVQHDWIDHRWRVTGILPGAAAVPDWTVLEHRDGTHRYYAGAAELLLFPGETDTLKYNIEGENPAIYVFLRPHGAAMTLAGATACPGEAHAHADTGTDLVEAVPMPADLQAWIAAFVAEHHVDRPAWKRTRDGARKPKNQDADP